MIKVSERRNSIEYDTWYQLEFFCNINCAWCCGKLQDDIYEVWMVTNGKSTQYNISIREAIHRLLWDLKRNFTKIDKNT